MSSESSSEAPKIRAWLHRHNPARSSHWPWSASESSRPEHQSTSAAEIKSRLRNFVRRHSRQDLPPLSRSASRQTVPSNTATPEPPPPYSPLANIPPSPPTQAPLPSVPPADVLISPPGIDDDTPPPGYRNPVGPRPSRAVSDAIEASLNEERHRLEAVFTLHPWNLSWGPRPLTLNEALKRAAFLGNQRLVFTLLDAGAQITSNDRDIIPEDSPIHSALYGSNPKIALDLLKHESISAQARKDLLESRNTLGLTPLHIAVEAGKTEIARELIELGSSVDAVDRFGRTSLHIAARYGRTETLDMLLDQGADSKINRQLWIRAADCGHSQDALGQYGSISRALQDALDRWGERIRIAARERRMSMGQASLASSFISQSGVSFVDFISETNEYRGARDRRSWASSIENYPPHPAGTYSSLLDDTELPHAPPRRAHPRPITTFINSELPRRYPGSLHGHSNSEDQFMGRHFRAGGGPSTPRRKAVPPTLVYTPEYLRWKRGCEALQAESRAQREKNKMIEERIMGRRKDKLFRILAEARRCNNADFVTFTARLPFTDNTFLNIGVTRKEFYRVVQKRRKDDGASVRIPLWYRGDRRFNYLYDYDDETEILTVQILYSDPFGPSKNKIYYLEVNILEAIRDAAGRRNTTDKFRWINAPLMFRGVVRDNKCENDFFGRSLETTTRKSKGKGKGDEDTDTDTDTDTDKVLSIWKTASAIGGPYLKQPGSAPIGGIHTEHDEWPSLVIIHALPQYLSWLRRDMRRWFATSGHEVKIVLLITWSGPDPQQDTIIERWEEEQEEVVEMETDGEEGTEKQPEAASTSEPNKKEFFYRPKLQQPIRISLELTRGEDGELRRSYQVSDDLVLSFRLLFRREPRTPKEKDVVYPTRQLKFWARDLHRGSS